jgi:transcriptional regulator with XRE-family HTH domain
MTTQGPKHLRVRTDSDELRATLARHKIRQAEVGAAAGLSRAYVSLVAQGLQPNATTARKLLRGLLAVGVPEQEARRIVQGASLEEAKAAP